ncbi:hypothetical protein Hanom_Chr04g00308781 [Helianthus anomalus]
MTCFIPSPFWSVLTRIKLVFFFKTTHFDLNLFDSAPFARLAVNSETNPNTYICHCF